MFSITAQDLIADLSSILFHAIWLGVVVGLALLGLQRLARQKSASLRYGIDVTGLWLLLCLPVFTWYLLPNQTSGQRVTALMDSQSIPGDTATNVKPIDLMKSPALYSNWQDGKSESSCDLQSSTTNTDQSVLNQNGQFVSGGQANGQQSSAFLIPPNIVVMAWGLGVVLFSLRLIVGYFWILKISASRSAIDPELLMRIESRYQNQKWRVTPRVFVSSKLSEAIVVGYLRPLVLVPLSWTKLHNQALNKIVEFNSVGFSLEEALVDIGTEHFRNRLVIDRQEFRKSGISLNSEVDSHVSGITLRTWLKLLLQPYGASYYFENGNIVVSSKLKVTHHRVSQKYRVAQILEHEEFFLGTETNYDPVGKVEQLIDFLQQEPSSPDWQAGWEKSTIDFDPETQRLVILAPQSHQVKIQQRLELLNQFIQQERGGLFPFRFRNVTSTISEQDNCIDKFLLTYKEQQRVKIAREEIPQKLQRKISVNFENDTLSTLIKLVADHAGVNIVVEEAALAEVGIKLNEPISVHLENVATATALDVVLQSYGLKSVIEDEVLKITSSERAEGELLVMVYSLSDLIGDSESPELELARIGELIQSVIAPDRWDDVGGVGSLVSHELTASLAVRQTRLVHDEIAWLLQELQNVRLGNEPEKQPKAVPKFAATVKKLEKLISLDINEESIAKTLEEWKQKLGIQIYVDQQGLLEAGITLDTKVSLKFHGTTQQLFRSLGLGYRVHNNLIVVTSKQRTAEPLRVQLYSTRNKHFERRGLKAVCSEMKSRCEPASWDVNGGAGVATFDGESEALIIRQSDEAHKRISEYLK